MIKELDRTIYEPVLIITYEGPVRKYFEDLGVKVYHLSLRHIWEAPNPPWYDLYHNITNWLAFRGNINLLKLIKEIKPDLVHINDTALLSAAITVKFAGIPLITHARSVVNNLPGLKVRQKLLLRKIYNLSERVIAISEEYVRQFKNKDKVEVVYNSIDLDEMGRIVGTGEKFRSELKLADKDIFVGMVGTLSRHKGAWDFINAAGIVLRKTGNMRIKFAIVGKIPNETVINRMLRKIRLDGLMSPLQKARTFAEKYNIKDSLLITGHRDDIYSVMDALDIVVFPTRLNATGRPVLEAAALGKPSIAALTTKNTNVLVDGVTGLIIPPGNTGALAEAIIRLAENDELRKDMGKAGLEHARMNFNPKINAMKVQKIYEEVLKEVLKF